jgi:hypothetical protein
MKRRVTSAQEVELLNWLAGRPAVSGAVRKVHRKYRIPINNTRRRQRPGDLRSAGAPALLLLQGKFHTA